MRFVGKTHPFLGDVLPSDFRPEIFKLVQAAWRRMLNPGDAWLEPRITGLLQQGMIAEQESIFRTNPPFFIAEDVKKRDPESGKEKERSDLEIHLYNHCIRGQKPYFVFESKRLNIPYGAAISSNAHEYVGDGGMGCLLIGGYDAVPNFSGMLAYVMDGKIAAAKKSVEAQLGNKSERLRFHGEAKIHSSSLMPKGVSYGETRHATGAETEVLFHMFLGVRRRE